MTKPIPFEAQVRRSDGIAAIDLNGELNAFAENELWRAYTEAKDLSDDQIVMNFNQVTYINSTGIALIVGLLAEARKTHTRVSVFGLSEHYVRIFQITRLVDFMSIYPDETAALANMAGQE